MPSYPYDTAELQNFAETLKDHESIMVRHDKWVRMFMWFCAAVPLFLIDLALVGWIKFIKTPAAAIAITVIVGITCVFWLADQCYWGTYISTVLDFKDENAGDHLVAGSGFDPAVIEMPNNRDSAV